MILSKNPPLTDWEVNSTPRTQGEHAVTIQSQTDTNALARVDTVGGRSGYCFHSTVSQYTHFMLSHTHTQ